MTSTLAGIGRGEKRYRISQRTVGTTDVSRVNLINGALLVAAIVTGVAHASDIETNVQLRPDIVFDLGPMKGVGTSFHDVLVAAGLIDVAAEAVSRRGVQYAIRDMG